MTFFYTDTVGISAALIGTMLLLARILDGVVDMPMGVLIYKTKSKHSKAIPFGLSAALFVTVASISYI